MEISLIKNLLQCHLSIHSNLNFIKSMISIREINEIFNNSLPSLNAKPPKEVNFILIY